MKRIFDFSGVPSEEKEAMRTALRKASVEFYETPPANWGSGQSGIWVTGEPQAEKASQIIAKAQNEWRSSSVREENPNPERLRIGFKVWLFIVAVSVAVFVFMSSSPRL